MDSISGLAKEKKCYKISRQLTAMKKIFLLFFCVKNTKNLQRGSGREVTGTRLARSISPLIGSKKDGAGRPETKAVPALSRASRAAGQPGCGRIAVIGANRGSRGYPGPALG